MKPQNLEEIKITFNILDNARKFTGHDRNYLLDNVTRIINSGATQERIRLREALGYYGHGLRRIVGMEPEERSLVKANGSSLIVDAVPSNVCSHLEIDSKGNITHIEEILDNDEGRKALGLHRSRVGGFSWACGGDTRGRNTLVENFKGMDYVRNPLFATNRGYVLDSADQDTQDELILDNLMSTGLNQDKATDALIEMKSKELEDLEYYREQLETALLDSANASAVLNENKSLNERLKTTDNRLKELETEIEKDKQVRQAVLDSACSSLGIVEVPKDIANQILDGSPEGFDALFGLANKAAERRKALGGGAVETTTTRSRNSDPSISFDNPNLAI